MPLDDLFFYYTRTMPDGRWTPQISAQHPDSLSSTRNVKGKPPRHTAPMGQARLAPLAGATRQLGLAQLAALYPAPAPAEPALRKPGQGDPQPDMRNPRPGETIGGGYTVFRLGRRSRRIRPATFPFEHATVFSAEDEAQRLAIQNPGLIYEVWGALTRITCQVKTAPNPAAASAEATATTGA